MHRRRPRRQPLVHRATRRNKVGRITTAGDITEFPIPRSHPSASRRPRRQPLVHRSTTATRSAGSRRPASSPSSRSPPAADPTASSAGPDGNLWFTETAATGSGASRRPASSPLAIPTTASGLYGIAARTRRKPLVHQAIGSRIGRIGLIRSGAIDLAIGPDNTTRVLRLSDGQMAVDSVDDAQAVSPGSPYGPYSGWAGGHVR